MRMGLQVSADRGRYATKVEKLQADARWADEAGLDSVWTPQIPDEFDVMTAATLIGTATSRIEVGTAIVPLQPRHPIVLAQQALSNQAVCEGRFTLGPGRLAPLDHSGHARPALRARRHDHALLPRRAGPGAARTGDGRRAERAVHDPQPSRRHRHRADTRHDRRAGPGHVEAGRRAGGRHHPVAGRRAHHRVPRRPEHHRRPPRRRADRRRAFWPASPSASAATTRSRPPWRARTARSARWKRRRTTSSSWSTATRQNIGDVLVCGSEATMEKRLRSFADAGLTDFNARIVPLGEGRDELEGLGGTDAGVPRRGRALAPGLRSPSAQARGRVTMPPDRKSHSWVAAWSPSRASSTPLMVWA